MRSGLCSPPPSSPRHGHQTEYKTEGEGRVRERAAREDRVRFFESAIPRASRADCFPQERSSSSSHRPFPASNVRLILALANIWVAEHVVRPFDTPNDTPPRSPTVRKSYEEEGFWSDVRTLRWVVRPCTHFSKRPSRIYSPFT